MPSKLYRRSDSGAWYCWIYDKDGSRKRYSTKCTDRKAALLVLRRFEKEAQGEGLSNDVPTYQVKEMMEDLLESGVGRLADATVEVHTTKAGHINRLLGELNANTLSHDHLLGYIDQRTEEKASQHTIHKELQTLRKAMRFATKRGHPIPPMEKVIPEHSAEYEPRDRWLTEDECAKLLSALSEHRRPWLQVAVYTGARKGELERLSWEHVDLQGKTIRMPGKKTKLSKRAIPIADPLAAVLVALPNREGPLLEPWEKVNRDLRQACIRAGVQRVSCNDLRRTFASWLLQRGVDPLTVARLLGHASLHMVNRVYGQLHRSNLEAAVAKLPTICDNGGTQAVLPGTLETRKPATDRRKNGGKHQ